MTIIRSFVNCFPNEQWKIVLFSPSGNIEIVYVELASDRIVLSGKEINSGEGTSFSRDDGFLWWYESEDNESVREIARKSLPKNDHGLTKYDRPIKGSKQGTIDVYAVIETFDVTCPARQHAIKKILCTGIRGKGSPIQDLEETKVAIDRAIQLQKQREAIDADS